MSVYHVCVSVVYPQKPEEQKRALGDLELELEISSYTVVLLKPRQ